MPILIGSAAAKRAKAQAASITNAAFIPCLIAASLSRVKEALCEQVPAAMSRAKPTPLRLRAAALLHSLLHHLLHVHFLIAGRNLEQARGLRAFLDVPEFHDLAVGVLRLH